jgi:GcrA cell cycle regulator
MGVWCEQFRTIATEKEWAMSWTPERTDLLRKLWADGVTASQIANQFGDVSRNAVIGKVHRLKLTSRGRPTTKSPLDRKPAKASNPGGITPFNRQRIGRPKPPQAPVPTTVVVTDTVFNPDSNLKQEPIVILKHFENAVVPVSQDLKLYQLNERTCKWPNGDPLAEDFGFCGNDVGENTGPYCAFHARIAFVPASERRRAYR